LPPVFVDVNQMHQAFFNICMNSSDAMPDGGALTIETRRGSADDRVFDGMRDIQPDNCCMIRICDTGAGIAPDIINRIFDPFFTTKEVGKGTGLGLSITFGIIKITGGDRREQRTRQGR